MAQEQIQPRGSVGGAGQQGLEYTTGTRQEPGANAAGQEQQFGGQRGVQTGGQRGHQAGGQPGSQQGFQPGGQQGTQPSGQQGVQAGGATASRPSERSLDDALTGEMRLALHDFVQAATVCEWCADRCATEGPQMAECIRLCRDVADLATLNAQFVARDSPFGPDLAETFADAADECARECAQHGHDHCQECASVLRRAVDSTWRMLESIERGQAAAPRQQGF